ncbi:SE1832 family protein [Litchfieldia alkalitelluris]|uniref:SE1832 family protein n=1 Tax=Litchfieldia alkalitelluris TaxID=304268 RepID=UPI0014728BC1|nr:SE1832 family protein [Litchfieldia alkalitelluris]
MMNTREVENKISELKMEYIRIQDDIERLESLGHSIEKQEEKLTDLEKELKYYRSLA